MASPDPDMQPSARVALAPFCTLGVGGAARWLVRATSLAAVESAHAWAADRTVPLFVLGGGSNLVIADKGVNGLVLQVALIGVEVSRAGADTLMTVAAGEAWDAFVADAVAPSAARRSRTLARTARKSVTSLNRSPHSISMRRE